ncbi:MAG: hypothetical protein KJ574_05250 [Nanoarchaeota archaeon]|nr:hypothetical protein [Nanoarchaeota archaeon]
MFEHHVRPTDIPKVLQVKSYEQRLILRELFYIQQEIRKNHQWLESYEQEPVSHLKAVAEKVTQQLAKLQVDEKDRISRLDRDSKTQLRSVTRSSMY